jgi:hypothetical protein
MSKQLLLVLVLLFVVALPASGVFAQEAPSIEIDLTPIFNGISANLPWVLALFGVIGGIMIAIALGKWIVNAVTAAFKGGKIS